MKKQLDFTWANYTPAQIANFVKKAEAIAKKNKTKLLNDCNNSSITADEFLSRLDNLDPNQIFVAPMKSISDVVEVWQLLPKNKDVKAAADKARQFVSEKMNEVFADKELADIVNLIKDEEVSPKFLQLLADWKNYYFYQGFFAGKNVYKKVSSIQNKIKAIETKFDSNIASYNKKVLCTREDLVGITDDQLSLFKKVTKGKHEGYEVGTSYPELALVQGYVKNSETRRKVLENFRMRGGVANLKLLNNLQDSCSELAVLLGFNNYVELTTSKNLIQTKERLDNFLTTLKKGIAPIQKKEFAEYIAFATKKLAENGEKRKPEPWDGGYYGRIQMEELFDLDSQKNKEYFPLDHVLQTFFDLVSTYFNIDVKKVSKKLWHKDADYFELVDSKTKQVLGFWILDLFPRDGKYTHMAAGNVIMSRKIKGERTPAVSVMFGNFNPATKEKPALLSFDELETLLHEFGHMSHGLFTQAEFISQAGTNTTLDYVEVPSQFFEEFLSTEKMIKKFSKHYKTGKTIPSDIATRLVASKDFGMASQIYGQLAQTELDSLLHTSHEKDILKLWRDIRKKYGLIKEPESYIYPANFGHLASQYTAGYWSYLVSLAFAKDCWSKIISSGKISKQELLRFKKEILETGSSRPELESLKEFLGREPKADSLVKYIKNS